MGKIVVLSVFLSWAFYFFRPEFESSWISFSFWMMVLILIQLVMALIDPNVGRDLRRRGRRY
jgi:hypothetical protein